MSPPEEFPLGSRVMIAELTRDPYPILAALREAEPVSWIPELGMWFVTTREDVVRVLKDPGTFTTASPESPMRDIFGEQMLSTDGDAGRRYKRLCTPPFTTVSVCEHAAAGVESKAYELVDQFAGDGKAELRTHFASWLAVDTVAGILGVADLGLERIRDWYDDFAAALANFTGDAVIRERGLRSAEAFRTEVRPKLATLDRKADESLLGRLAAGDHRLKDEEILSNAMLILFGGIETTESMILNAIWSLLTHPGQFEQVLRNENLLVGAIEESMRWEPAVQTLTRYVTRPVRLGGVDLDSGSVVQCMIAAANRDPAHFDEPDRFDIHRSNARDHFTLGFGSHFCLGAPLARLEGQVALRVLFRRLPNLILDSDHPAHPSGYEFRKPAELRVRF